MKDEIFETKISNVRWYIYDIFGNIVWISYIVGLVLKLKCTDTIDKYFLIIPAFFMLVGIGELIHERIKKQDRILPKWQLYLGFGSLWLGGLCGMIFSGIMIAISVKYSIIMCVGGFLCFLFAYLLFRGYKKI